MKSFKMNGIHCILVKFISRLNNSIDQFYQLPAIGRLPYQIPVIAITNRNRDTIQYNTIQTHASGFRVNFFAYLSAKKLNR